MSASITLAVIGGSRAYDLLSRRSFGEGRDSFQLDTPFGKSSPIHQFDSDGFSYYLVSRHGETGYSLAAPFINYRANIWALKEMGVERIVSWSSPGAINPRMRPGDIVVPADVIDMTRARPSTFYEGTGLGFIRMSDPFCPAIRKILLASASPAGSFCRDGGVYVCTEGPRLETPAEIRMFSQWGGDLVGMTLLPEAFLARELEMCYAAICLVTNFAEGVVERGFREGELFEGMMNEAESDKVETALSYLPGMLEGVLLRLASHKHECKCGLAMERYRRTGRIGENLLDEIRKRRS